MKKNRIQRLQEDMNEDLQKYLDEDMLDTTPKEKKESSFWMKCVAICLLCSYGIAQFLGRVLGDKQAIVQYNLSHHTDPPRADEVYEKRGNTSM